MSDQTVTSDHSGEFELLLGAAARYALGGVDGHAFVRWFADVVPLLCPDFAAKFEGSESERRAAFGALGRLLWNRLPLPDHQFRPQPLQKPERNAACSCGSGRKYKHCCARVDALPDPFESLSLLMYVLQQLPRTQLRVLPLAGLDVEELAHIGHEWSRNGRAADTEALLEHMFADPDRLDERAQRAFDVLADAYDALGRPKKKERLIARVAQARDPWLRSAALHRRITIVADRGEREQAWRLFAEAQRHQPDNPFLATLELTMLMNERSFDRLQERGRFWIARLSRDREHDYGELIARIRELCADPAEAEIRYAAADRPGVADLQRAIAAMPAPECRYTIDCAGDDGVLVPDAELARLEAEWRGRTGIPKPDLTMLATDDPDALDRAHGGLAWLAQHPAALQSLDVLDDVALIVRTLDLDIARDALLEPLTARAEALVRLAISRGQRPDVALPWFVRENRPALRLLAGGFYLHLDNGHHAGAVRIGRWLVHTLNPNDNHGLRAELLHACLDAGDTGAALDLCERFPDDGLVELLFSRALALFMAGRVSEAEAALRAATKARPKVLPALLAASPKRLRRDQPFLAIGGPEEAWGYRENALPLWERSGALAWAREVAAARRRR